MLDRLTGQLVQLNHGSRSTKRSFTLKPLKRLNRAMYGLVNDCIYAGLALMSMLERLLFLFRFHFIDGIQAVRLVNDLCRLFSEANLAVGRALNRSKLVA